MTKGRRIEVVSPARPAKDRPNFVIKEKDGPYYVAVAVVVYDESKMTDKQTKRFQSAKQMFDKALRESAASADLGVGGLSFSEADDLAINCVQTDPPCDDAPRL